MTESNRQKWEVAFWAVTGIRLRWWEIPIATILFLVCLPIIVVWAIIEAILFSFTHKNK